MSRLLCLLLLLPFVSAQADDYLTGLTTAAHAQRLQDAPEWRALLHYRGAVSEAVTPAFFLAADGAHDPAAELDATLTAFFTPAADADAAAQCRFVARYRWLKEELHFDVARLPERGCPAFAKWYADIDPGSLVLVFPAAYLNNPASMYGHTLLRFDRTGRGPEAELESVAANFSADIPGGEGLASAYRGLSGRYRGHYDLEPYYQMVREYSDIEDRDIWEYRLSYTPAERARVLEHLWELRDVQFHYYYFDRNCSYYLLSLLDVARPAQPLAAHFVYQVIPGDALQAVLSQPGVLEQERYRPSLAARIRARLATMDGADRARVLTLLDRSLAPDAPVLAALPDLRQAAIYDVVTDRLLYAAARGDMEKDDYASLMQAVVTARAALPQDADPIPTPDTDPATGHGSMRSGVGAGRDGGTSYTEVSLRGAYHDMLDPTPGFATGAAIDMGGIAIRRDAADARLHLESLELLEVASLTPRDLFYQPFSWDVGMGWQRRWLGQGRRPLLGDLHAGLGSSYGDDALVYGLVDATLLTGGGIPDGYALGLGPRVGLVWRALPRLNFELGIRAEDFPDHLHGISLWYSAATNVALGRDVSLRVNWSRQGLPGDLEDEIGLSLYWYF